MHNARKFDMLGQESEECAMFCVYCGRELPGAAHFCPYCGKPVPDDVRAMRPAAQPVSPVLPLNWYRFLTTFGLLALAALFALNAVVLLAGWSYGRATARIYREVGAGMVALDIVTGALLVGLAALAVFARFRLTGWHQNGPLCLYLTFGTWALLLAAHMTGAVILALRAGHSLMELTTGPTLEWLFIAAAALCLSVPYFKRRRELFVN